MFTNERLMKIVGEVHEVCEAMANPALAQKYSRYFTEGYDAWGVKWDDPAWTERKNGWLEGNRDLGLDGFLELGRLLFQTGKYEDGGVAIFFLKALKTDFRPETLEGLARWFDGGIRNWGHTDVLSGEVLSHFLTGGIVRFDAFAPWLSSPHKYQRRAVPVTLLALLKQDAEIQPVLEFLRPLMMDGEKVVQQGTGWFLREAWKKQPKPVERFLMEWKDRAPRVIYQYATEKMTPAAKERFRKSKPKAGAAVARRR